MWSFAQTAALVAVVLVPAPRLARAEPPRIRLRGAMHVEAKVTRTTGKVALTVAVTLDDGQPSGKVPLEVVVKRESGAPVSAAPDRDAAAKYCEPYRGAPAARATGNAVTYAVETDEFGGACLELGLPPDRYALSLSTPSTPLYDGASAEARVDMGRRALTLDFNPRPRTLSLDAAAFTVDATAQVDDEGRTLPASGTTLVLSNERGDVFGTSVTNAQGRASWSVQSARIGPPGRGELRIDAQGDARTSAARVVAEVERRERVELTAPQATAGRLPAGAPEDGIAVVIEARTAAGDMPNGSVEAVVGDTIVGAAPMVGGKADVVMTFPRPSTREVRVRFRYGADAPWHEASSDLALLVPMRAPSPWRNVPLLLAGLVVIAWLAASRARRVGHLRAAVRTAKPPASARPSVEVVKASRDRRAGWSGVVIDAHEGTPVQGARIAVERAGFEAVARVAETTVDEAGHFVLPGESTRDDDVLVVEGALHAALRQPLPPSGELRIALVLRRRALLDRLVSWARKKGRPFDGKAEPTPGHVRHAAGNDGSVARWADAVERVAFGPAEVDATAEAGVEALRPDISAEKRAGAAAMHDTVVDDPEAGGPPPHLTRR